jgi:hypothetical protein
MICVRPYHVRRLNAELSTAVTEIATPRQIEVAVDDTHFEDTHFEDTQVDVEGGAAPSTQHGNVDIVVNKVKNTVKDSFESLKDSVGMSSKEPDPVVHTSAVGMDQVHNYMANTIPGTDATTDSEAGAAPPVMNVVRDTAGATSPNEDLILEENTIGTMGLQGEEGQRDGERYSERCKESGRR